MCSSYTTARLWNYLSFEVILAFETTFDLQNRGETSTNVNSLSSSKNFPPFEMKRTPLFIEFSCIVGLGPNGPLGLAHGLGLLGLKFMVQFTSFGFILAKFKINQFIYLN